MTPIWRAANPKAGTIACQPFERNSLEVRREGGVAIPTQRDRLTGLSVIYGNDDFHPGDIVFFEGDQCASLWAKKVYSLEEPASGYTIDGYTTDATPRVVKFVLAPVNLVMLVERTYQKSQS